MCSGMEYQNEGPEYLIVNFRVCPCFMHKVIIVVPSIVIVDFHLTSMLVHN